MQSKHIPVLALVAASALAGCGGGGGTASQVTPSLPISTPAAASNMQFVIKVPAPAGTSSASVKRQYVSAATRSIKIAIQGGATLGTFDVSPASSLCKVAQDGSRSCTISTNAPSGNDTFVVTAYDQPNGSGNTLASGDVVQTVSSTQTSTIDLSLMTGVMSRYTVSLGNPYPPAGAAASVPVIVQAYDADGNTIIGTYDRTITVHDADTSGHTQLSATTIAGSSSTVTLAYDGAPFTSTSITASAPNLAAPAAITFAPTPTVANKFSIDMIMQPNQSYESGAGAEAIAAGPDGNLWVTAATAGAILRFTPSGTMTIFWPPTLGSFPQGIVVGKDGALWFTESQGNNIGRVTTSGVFTEYPIPTQYANPLGITNGPDGNVWFTEPTPNKIAKIDGSGAITEYQLPALTEPIDVATGPDGNLWVGEQYANAIAVVKPDGTPVASYPIPTKNAEPYGMTLGLDKNLWFGEYQTSKIARITPSGQITEYATPSAGSGPVAFANGPDGNIWFAENGAQFAPTGQIGYINPSTGNIREVFLNEAMHTRGVTFDSAGNLWYTGFYYDASEVGQIVY